MTLTGVSASYRSRTRWICGLGRLAPCLLVISIAIWGLVATQWITDSMQFVRVLTPWVGAIALACEGSYLLAVAFRVTHIWLAVARHDEHVTSEKELRRWLMPVLNVLSGVVIFSVIFYFGAARVITQNPDVAACRLLWCLTVGAFLVAVTFGEFLVRFLNVLERLPQCRLALSPVATDAAAD